MMDGSQLDFGGASGIPNALVLSLYLVESASDVVGRLGDTPQDDLDAAQLYRRLCRASAIANGIISSASSAVAGVDDGRSRALPWTCGGDPPCFGVHCSLENDEYLSSTSNLDGDDLWQSRSPSASSTENERLYQALQQNHKSQVADTFQQPHLRAICRYGNDVNDMWRMISLAFEISARLHEVSLSCAIECWDNNDGHVLLIEAAEHLPSWVDDDVLVHGGVGGPEGCRNRCWIANGVVHLIPPPKRDQSSNSSAEVTAELSRRDALLALIESLHGEGGGTEAPEAVQCALEHRMARTDYSGRRPEHLSVQVPDESTEDRGNPHWQVAAAALPASVARFIQTNPSLVPLIVDSFCQHAPAYLRGRGFRKEQQQQTDKRAGGDDTDRCASLGTLFHFEQVVAAPVTMTRANFAELITGRGTVPSFPVPKSYRNVELNRMARRLRQTLVYADDDKKRNPFHRAVDVGIRLCAGLEWIASAASKSNMQSQDAVTESLGRVERRIRLYWTRIDTEASRPKDYDVASQPARGIIPWIEQTWQLGPNGAQSASEKLLVQALGEMSRCHVFEPELSTSLWDEPCPITRPGISLSKLVQSGMKASLRWQREECNEYSFPMPGAWEVDDDSWVEVNSLHELENEMKELSSSGPPEEDIARRRRPNRRRRRRITGQDETGEVESGGGHSRVLDGVASFISGEGEVEGVVTDRKAADDSNRESILPPTPKHSMSREVDIDPRKFVCLLQETLRGQGNTGKTKKSTLPLEDDMTKFFYPEDLEMNDDPVPIQNGQDSLSLNNIMVRHFLTSR